MDLARIIAAVLLRWTKPPNPILGHRFLGNWGERQAARFLKSQGWKILYSNYHPSLLKKKKKRGKLHGGEIDLVCRDGATLVFVEVKTRRKGEEESGGFRPADAVNDKKRQLIREGVRSWLRSLGDWEVPYRIDIVEVIATQPPQFHRIESAFLLAQEPQKW